MDTCNFIKDLLLWIDNNLENDLSIDAISHRSGYSKWHLQRMFRAVTGRKIGTYVRERRLTRAAFSMRMTKISIVDIAVLYNFESQQSFTRAFKKLFGKAPGYYRRTNDWSMKELCPPFNIERKEIPSPAIIYMPDMDLSDVTHSYFFRPDHFTEESIGHHADYLYNYLKRHKITEGKLYGMRKFQHKAFNSYSIAQVKAEHTNNKTDCDYFKFNGGAFIKFSFHGKLADFQKFVVFIYNTCLPLLGVVRRDDCDIEIFHISGRNLNLSEDIFCDYLIPVNAQKTAFKNQ